MEWSQHSIIIGIPKNYWDKFDAHNKDTFKYIYMYSIILPVLTEAIVKIQYGDQEDEFKDRKWYTVIEQEIEKMETNEENAHVIAQMLLDNPFSNFSISYFIYKRRKLIKLLFSFIIYAFFWFAFIRTK